MNSRIVALRGTVQSGWLRSRGPGLALWQAHAVAVRAKAFVARSHVPGLRLLSDGAPPVSMASTEQRKASPAADSGSGKGAAAATLTELPAIYFEVGKGKLSALVTLTAAAGYAMAVPVGAPIMWDMLAMTSGGTMLAAMSASAFNQVIERDNDRRMTRTAKRPLVMGKISPLHGYTAASLAGVGGVALLAIQINPVVAALGAANIGLYTSVYTPMKQQTHWNTWMGAVVGAIPPIMGWAAVTGDVGIGALLMGGVLFSWQMPHFLSLAYMMRNDYKAGGYVMLPGEAGSSSLSRATKAAMRHSIYLQVLCAAAPVLGMTDAVFVAEATLLNGGLLYLAYQFHNHGAAGNQGKTNTSARRLFLGSLVYLPLLLACMVFHRSGEAAAAPYHPGAVKGEECPFTEATKMVSAHEMNGKGDGTEVVDGA